MSPAEEYRERLQARRERAEHYHHLHLRLGNLRLLLFVATAALAWAVWGRDAFSGWWLLAPLALLLLLAQRHSRIQQAQRSAKIAAAVYERGLARIEDRWTGTGQTGDRFADAQHVYSADLDLFGRGSVFELLSTARTRMGEDTLAGWLLSPAAPSAIGARQVAIADLRDRLDFREEVATLEADVAVGVHPEALLEWAEAPGALTHTWVRGVAALLALMAIAGAVLWGMRDVFTPLAVVLLVEFAVAFSLRRNIEAAIHGAENAFNDLGLLAGVLARIEREPFTSLPMRSMQQQLLSAEKPASAVIDKLGTLATRIAETHNFVFDLINVPLLYRLQLAFAAENWRRAHGHDVRRWLQTVGEIEALLSLATYSYEHPADPFPEFVEGQACFAGQELGHPLIPAGRCVRNSVELCGELQVLLVSGSNMSGKSTLLRTVGLNAVLAMAGAPVRARHLRLTPLHVGASLRISDSLQEGSSRFYAEIKRLRHIVDIASGNVPLLFLVDEFLQGTNSNDRRIGAEALLRELCATGAIGLVTTHDLALTEVAGMNGRLRNVHFEDYMQDGHLHFDYILRPGVVARSNGLELMRSIGLDV